jgi:hypothetical protein
LTVGATIGTVQASTTGGWSIVRTPNPASGALHFGALDAVACTSSTACIAVGSGVNNRANQIAIAASWNGIAWTAQNAAVFHGTVGAALAAVSCTAINACVAAGYARSAAGVALPLIERWNGSAWNVQDSPAGRGGSLTGISCVSTTDCTAVGTTSDAAGATVTLAEQWDGVKWIVEPTPSIPGAPYAVLSAVSCSAAAACTAVGATTAAGFGTLAERWNGISWSLEPMSVPSNGEEGFLTGVSCVSATMCVAAGDYIDSSFITVTLAEQWNGTNWTTAASPNPAGAYILQMTGVSCTTASACTAVGWTQAGTMALRFNGSAWTLEPTPPPSGPQFVTAMLNGVSCASVISCVSVGSFAGTLAEAWNGSAWSLTSTPNMPGVLSSALVDVACSAANNCVAVGNQETAAGGVNALTETWNGAAWTMKKTPAITGAMTVMLSGVACAGSSACVAVGWDDTAAGTQEPLAEVWDGTAWSVQPTPSPSGSTQSVLSSVSCPASTTCVAVGSYQTASGHQLPMSEFLTGGAWTVQSVALPANGLQGRLTSVSCPGVASCVAVGAYLNGAATVGRGHAHQPMAAVWNGVSWAAESIARPAGAPASYLDGISCTTDVSCVAVGWFTGAAKTDTAMAYEWNGTAWTMQASADVAGAALGGVSCIGTADCTAVGATHDGATLAEGWNGSAWSVQATPNRIATPREFSAVTCVSSVSCVAVGASLGSAGYTVTLAEQYGG